MKKKKNHCDLYFPSFALVSFSLVEVQSVFCVVGVEFIGAVRRHLEGPATGHLDSIVLGFLRLQANSGLIYTIQSCYCLLHIAAFQVYI
jgi:hypothetical protein